MTVKAHSLCDGRYAITVDGDYIGDVWSKPDWYWSAYRRVDFKSWCVGIVEGYTTRRDAVDHLRKTVGA